MSDPLDEFADFSLKYVDAILAELLRPVEPAEVVRALGDDCVHGMHRALERFLGARGKKAVETADQIIAKVIEGERGEDP